MCVYTHTHNYLITLRRKVGLHFLVRIFLKKFCQLEYTTFCLTRQGLLPKLSSKREANLCVPHFLELISTFPAPSKGLSMREHSAGFYGSGDKDLPL